MSLIARHLEENGIPSVVIAAARDIVEHCGVARMLFVDFPLRNPCGEPGNTAMQRRIIDIEGCARAERQGPRAARSEPGQEPTKSRKLHGGEP